MQYISQLLQSPVGPTTVHFWGPMANWALVVAGVADSKKPANQISLNMTATLMLYSFLFMRFAWRIQPRNLLLLSCHTFNAGVQGYQLHRRIKYDMAQKQLEYPDEELRSRIPLLKGGLEDRQS